MNEEIQIGIIAARYISMMIVIYFSLMILFLFSDITAQNITRVEIIASNFNTYIDITPIPDTNIAFSDIIAWNNPQSTSCTDNQTATAILMKNQITHLIQVSNWNFSIPNYSKIQKIEVHFNKITQPSSIIQDYSVALFKTIGNSLLIKTLVNTQNWLTIGQPFNNIYPLIGQDLLWGTTWQPSDINSPSFGVSFQVTAPSTANPISNYAGLICVSLIVTYANCIDNCNYPAGICDFSSFTCQCTSGYTGISCNIAVSETTFCSIVCLNGGICYNDTCDCIGTGFSGSFCESSDSDSPSEQKLGTKTVQVSAIIGLILLGFLAIILIIAVTVALYKRLTLLLLKNSPIWYEDDSLDL